MDPKGIAKYGPWEDNQPTQGQFRRVVVFNDGTKGYEIYEYGTDGPINEAVTDPKLGNDSRQAADFLDYQKKTQDLNKQAGGAAQESISAPANTPWVARTGPINDEHPDGIYWTENKNFDRGGKKASGQPYKNAGGQWVQRWDDGTTTVLPPEATPFEKPEVVKKNPGAPYKNAQGQWVRPGSS